MGTMLTPRLPDEPCLIISDGSLGSLVLSALVSESDRIRNDGSKSLVYPAMWSVGRDHEDVLPSVDRATQDHAESYGLEIVSDRAGYPSGDEPGAMSTIEGAGLHETRLLLDACSIALARGIRRVVWGAQIHDGAGSFSRLDLIARALDRATLSGRLATLDAPGDGGVEVVVETPIADMSDEQLVELALDLSVAHATCWWGSVSHPIADELARRFEPLLKREALGA